jgi:hypothetical protein
MFVKTQTTNRPAFGWRFLKGLQGVPYRYPRRRGGLGCDCTRRGMGDASVYDIQYGGGVADPTGGGGGIFTTPYTLPDAAGGIFTTPYTLPDAAGGPSIYDIQYGGAGIAPSAGTYVQTAGIQAGNIAPVSTLSPSGGLLPTGVLSLPSVGAPAGTAPRATSSLLTYLPWAALALGGVVLISAVKKK